MFPLLNTIDDDGFTVTGGTVVWVLLVIILVLLAVYLLQRLR